MSSKTSLILHPVRLRIVQSFVVKSKWTAQELGGRLQDVPQATLYRHLQKLVDGGVLEVVEEHPVRGTVQRVYGLHAGGGTVGAEESKQFSREEHRQFFGTFVATLLHDFDRYLSRPEIDLARDGVGYRQIPLYLSDEEFVEFAHDLSAAVMKYATMSPSSNRTCRMFTTILIPEPAPSSEDPNKDR